MSDSELTPEQPQPAEPAAPEAVSPPGGATNAAPAPKRRKSVFDDPIVRAMAWIAGGLVVLYAVGIISAIYFGILGNSTPKTMTENQVSLYKTQIDSGDKSTETYAAYATLLIQQRQFAKAQQVIDQALKIVDQSRNAGVTIAQANLYLAKGDYKGALASVDEAQKIIKEKYDQEMAKKGTSLSRSYGMDKNYWEAELLRASVYQAMGDNANQLASLTTYLKSTTGDTVAMIRRAKLRVKMGDKAGAIADYKDVLKFDPTNAAATDALKQIGAGQ